MSEPVLLPVFDSVHVHATDTLLVSVAAVLDATFTASVRTDVPPLPAIALVVVHVTVAGPTTGGLLQVQPADVGPVNVNPVGNMSITVTVPLDGAPPLLVTVTTIESPTSFTVKVEGLCVLPTVRSATDTTTVSLQALLLSLLSTTTFPGSTAHTPPLGFT